MDAKEKAAFIDTFTTAIARTAKSKIAEMPEEWDGHELRQYLADQFAWEVSSTMRETRSRRLREYRNTVSVKNL